MAGADASPCCSQARDIRPVGQLPSLAEVEDAASALPRAASPRMKLWAHETVPPNGSARARLRRLSHALLDPRGFQLSEQSDRTGTAGEVFRSRRANCVGYSMLFASLARELGVPVYFLTFDRAAETSQRGDLRVSVEHMAIGYGAGNDVIVFDLAGESHPSPRQVKHLSDDGASAIFYSNLGVELLLDGKARAAVEHLEIAVRLDPLTADGWSNLGVALRRLGARRRAREAYRRALELDPDSETARDNLALLHEHGGRGNAALPPRRRDP